MTNSLRFRKGETYPIEMLTFAKPNLGKCYHCGRIVYFSPIVKIMFRTFIIMGFKTIYSTEKPHSCFETKLEQPEPEAKSETDTRIDMQTITDKKDLV